MAPVSQIFTWAALATIVTTRPLLNPRRPDMVTETHWVTVSIPVTLWLDENGPPLSTIAHDVNFAAMPTVPTTFSANITASPVAPSAMPTVTSAWMLARVSSQQPVRAQSPPASLVSTTTYISTTSAAHNTTYTPPATTSNYSQIGRQDTTAAAAPSPAATQDAAAGGDTNAGAISASGTNMCTSTSDACSGDITHYDGGLGACGWTVDTATDMQIALPYGFMGTQSNGNPYCGKSLTIMNPTTGRTIQATVGDKCMGCTGRSIDLTDAVFNTIGNGCDGRCSGFEWWFD